MRFPVHVAIILQLFPGKGDFLIGDFKLAIRFILCTHWNCGHCTCLSFHFKTWLQNSNIFCSSKSKLQRVWDTIYSQQSNWRSTHSVVFNDRCFDRICYFRMDSFRDSSTYNFYCFCLDIFMSSTAVRIDGHSLLKCISAVAYHSEIWLLGEMCYVIRALQGFAVQFMLDNCSGIPMYRDSSVGDLQWWRVWSLCSYFTSNVANRGRLIMRARILSIHIRSVPSYSSLWPHCTHNTNSKQCHHQYLTNIHWPINHQEDG